VADLNALETMIENAGEAGDIAATEVDAQSRQRWLEIAAAWRVLAERELSATLGGATTLQ